MGMFDTVRIRCPRCGHVEEVQSKEGPCTLETFELHDAPLTILGSLRPTRTCGSCERQFRIIVQHTVAVVPDEPRRRSREEEEDDEA